MNDHEPERNESKEDEELQDACAEHYHGYVAVAVVGRVARVMTVIRVLGVLDERAVIREPAVICERAVVRERAVIRVDGCTMNVRAHGNPGVAVCIHVHVQTGQLSGQQTHAHR